MENLKQNIEALIFTSEQSITVLEMQSALKAVYSWEVTTENIKQIIAELAAKYQSDDYAFELVEIASGFRFLSKKEYYALVNTMLQISSRKRLTTAALETLAIVAYKQPVTKGEIESIRGVSSDYAVQKLLEKELIIISGRNEKAVGQPLIYSTSKNFMDYFGINSADELPRIKEVLAEQLVEPTIMKDTLLGGEMKTDGAGETEALAVTNGGELIVNKEPGEGEES